MAKLNHQRFMTVLLGEICARRGVTITGFSEDWIFCLQRKERSAYVFGYDFGLNSATAKMICKDKAATSELLTFHGVPCIEHRIFHGPMLAGFVPQSGNWHGMLAFLTSHPMGLVCKPNEGTGGNAVFKVTNAAQLETAVYQVFAKSRSLCLSPFETFALEYRVALLCGTVQFIYRKRRPALTGDGRSTLRQLLLDSWKRMDPFSLRSLGIKALSEGEMDWDRCPAAGEQVELNWRHNLGQGATPELLLPGDPAYAPAAELALRATSSLGVALASVDIAETSAGLKILEINSGIMMENLAESHPDGFAIARDFYDKIVCRMFDLEFIP